MLMSTRKIRKIDQFELLRKLGKGAQGTVFLAWDPALERRVAIKVLARRAAAPGASEKTAPSEGRLAGRLSHPNIVPVYQTGRFAGYPYLVFEYVPGLSLRALLRRDGPLTVERACTLLASVLDGIAHAHDLGVIHLDLSPGNIIVDMDGVPRIMDFGLARFAHAPIAPSARPRGTLLYMAPEHFGADPLGPWTDVYALALIFYELITGVPVRTGATASRVVKQIVGGTVDLQAVRAPEERRPLARFLEGALAREPKARYRDGRQMRDALRAAMPGVTTAAADERHGTVDFLLRRMGRRDDFPALSSSLTAINRATASDSKASANQVAGVILRDYALAQKVLKLANSAFYGGGSRGEVSSVSSAVRLLGFDQILLAACSVTFLEHFQRQGCGRALTDMLLRAFMTGLVTRHLVKNARLPGPEEAFICGMFHNLGEHLVLHYFPEEHAAIDAVIAEGLGRDAAARAILGISYGDLGSTVARVWKLPEIIANSIAAQPDDVVTTPKSVDEAFGHYAAFANELCLLPGSRPPAHAVSAIATLTDRFEPSFSVPEAMLYQVLEAALKKLGELAPALGLQLTDSDFHQGVRELLAWREAVAAADLADTAIDPAAIVA